MARILAERPRLALGIAPLVYGFLWAAGLVVGLRLDFVRDKTVQFVGKEELASVTYSELWRSLHVQPPGFNTVLKFADSLPDGGSLFWLLALFAGTCLALWMVGDIALQLTGDPRFSVVVGLLAAIVPGTLYFSLWVFYTQVSAILIVVLAWGFVAGLMHRSVLPLALSCLAAVSLFLIRSTYMWVVVCSWLIVVGVLAWRRLPRGGGRLVILGVVLVCSVGVLFVQGQSFARFGTLGQSSWAYEHSVKALFTQMTTEDRIAAARGDECLEEMVQVGVFKPITDYPVCALRSGSVKEILDNPILTSVTWINGSPNQNYFERLHLTDEWRAISMNALSGDPLAALSIPLPNFTTQERGTMLRFLWPSAWYWIIDSNVAKGGWLSSAWIVVFSWVPLAAIAGLFLGMLRIRTLGTRKDPRRVIFLTLATALLGISVAYLYLETGENERFRAEIDWLLIAVGAVGWWIAWRARSNLAARRRRVDSPAT